jgi:type VI secretion system secreted protein Hcp
MAYDAFLKIEGPEVKGESTDKGHEGSIEIFSFSWGASNPSTIGSHTRGSGGGKVTISDFTVVKRSDRASAALFKQCCSGTHFATAKVTLRKSGGDKLEYLIYEFEEVFVDNMQWSGSAGGDDSPMETVSFTFGKVKATYTEQNEDGTPGAQVIYGWDVRNNTAEEG